MKDNILVILLTGIAMAHFPTSAANTCVGHCFLINEGVSAEFESSMSLRRTKNFVGVLIRDLGEVRGEDSDALIIGCESLKNDYLTDRRVSRLRRILRTIEVAGIDENVLEVGSNLIVDERQSNLVLRIVPPLCEPRQ